MCATCQLSETCAANLAKRSFSNYRMLGDVAIFAMSDPRHIDALLNAAFLSMRARNTAIRRAARAVFCDRSRNLRHCFSSCQKGKKSEELQATCTTKCLDNVPETT